MLISILTPLKNAQLYLHHCAVSVMQQKNSYWEWIIVDDHSIDHSFEILKEIQQKDERIKPLKNKGKGIIDALKTAYSKAQGDFITRMDADDLMHEDKLSVMKDQLLQYGEGHIATSLVTYFAEKGVNDGYKNYEEWLNKLTLKGKNFQDIYKECVIPSPSWMLHRSDFEKIGAFNNLSYPEDYALAFEMYKAGLKVIPSDKVLHYWRDHDDRASRNDPNYADNTFIPLKVKYFLEIDYHPEKTLVIWGAGKKGKKIAQLLLEKKIAFDWVTDNEKKHDQQIYGIPLKPFKASSTAKQFIIAVANKEEQSEISEQLKLSSPNAQIFYFC